MGKKCSLRPPSSSGGMVAFEITKVIDYNYSSVFQVEVSLEKTPDVCSGIMIKKGFVRAHVTFLTKQNI